MTEIVLLRHGETEWDREDRLHGHAPVPLTRAGRESVETIGQGLASTYEFDRVYAAETLAARETAALVRLAGVEPRPTIEPAWRPRDAGVHQGLAYEELALTDEPDSPRTDVDVLQPLPRSGETLTAGRHRILDRWRRLCEEAGDDERILVVTHDFPIATVLGTIAGADPVDRFGAYAPGECSVTTVRLAHDQPTVDETSVKRRRIVNG
jgi:probable phosphoglycerate mutase